MGKLSQGFGRERASLVSAYADLSETTHAAGRCDQPFAYDGEEIAALEAEYANLPADEVRRRLVATVVRVREEADLLRQELVHRSEEVHELRNSVWTATDVRDIEPSRRN